MAFYILIILDALKLKDAETQIADLQTQLGASHKENNILRQQLIAILQSHHSLSNDDPNTPKPSSVSYSDYERLVQKVDVLQKQLLESNKDRKTEGRARLILVNKLKTAKSTAKEWMNYSFHQESRGVESPSLIARKPQSVSAGIEPLEDIVLSNDKLLSLEDDQLPTPSNENISRYDVLAGEGVAKISTSEVMIPAWTPSVMVNPIPSSQQETVPFSTEQSNQESTTSAPAKRTIDDIDDFPVVVKERAVKRRRIRKKLNQEEENQVLDLSKVKQEPVSPVAIVNRTETLDLDEVGIVVHTPRRQTRVFKSSRNSDTKSLELRIERSQSEPLDIHQSQQQISIRKTVEVGPISSTPRREEISSNDSRGQSQPPETATEINDPSNPSTPLFNSRPALEPVDVNERLLPRLSKGDCLKRRVIGRGERPRVSHGIHSVSEDGEYNSENRRYTKSMQSARCKERVEAGFAQLNALMDAPDSSTSTRITRTSARRSAPDLKLSVISKNSHNEQHQISSSKSKSPRELPLRALPLSSLTLADFKLNPKLNQGLDYAFNHTIYGNDRRCLSGCTDPHCCGEAMQALASALKPTLSRPARPVSPEDATLTDEEYLIKWFLGSAWNRQEFTRMSTSSREKLLLDAQTKLVANQYGKHRNVSERRMSPPGFWDPDIPNTQEQQMQRREAEKLERGFVAERHREAMKRGKWLFRDE
jgi:DNA repair protein endonuclease SAE2/CtIP C-terminus